jgi:O-antigen/teichoic acid export membrane protein
VYTKREVIILNEFLKRYNYMSAQAKAGFWFVVCSCFQSGIKFISLPIFANIMTVSDYGTVTLYTSWMSVIFIFATLALGRSNGVFYVVMVKFPEEKDNFTSAMEGLTIALCTVSFAIIYLSTFIFGDWLSIGIAQYGAMCIELIGYGIMLLWSLRMRYDYEYRSLLLMTVAYSVGTIFFPVLGVIFCPSWLSPAAAKNWCSAIASFIVGMVALLSSLKKSNHLYDLKHWKYAVSFNVALVPHYLSNVILVQSDRIMIAAIISEAAAAIYNVAYTLGVAAQVITQALINAINPWMYRKMSDGDGNNVRKVVFPMIVLVAVQVLVICLIMPEAFSQFFPKSYSAALNVVPPVAAGVLWAFIFNLYASIELYFSGNKLVSFASLTGAILNVIANLLLIPVFGFIAAAYTTLICDIVYAFMHTYFSRRLLKKNMPGIDVIPFVPTWIIGIVTTIGCFVILLLYPFPIVRYLIVVIVLAICVVCRRQLKKILKFKSL